MIYLGIDFMYDFGAINLLACCTSITIHPMTEQDSNALRRMDITHVLGIVSFVVRTGTVQKRYPSWSDVGRRLHSENDIAIKSWIVISMSIRPNTRTTNESAT